MSKKGYIIICAVLAVLVIAAVILIPIIIGKTGENGGGNASDKPDITYITELNDAYVGDNLRITATDFQVERDKAIFSDKVTTTVSIHFEIENLSDTERSFSDDDVSVYVDDVLTDEFEADTSLYGELMPGKKSTGDFGFEIPEDAGAVEVVIRDTDPDDESGKYASFRFEIPEVAETTGPADDPGYKDKLDEYADKYGEVVTDIQQYIDEHDGFVTDIQEYIDEHDGFVTDIQEFIDEHDGIVTDIQEYINGIVSDIAA